MSIVITVTTELLLEVFVPHLASATWVYPSWEWFTQLGFELGLVYKYVAYFRLYQKYLAQTKLLCFVSTYSRSHSFMMKFLYLSQLKYCFVP